MRGAARKIAAMNDAAVRDLNSNFDDVFREAQSVEHRQVTKQPAVADLRDGEIFVGLVSSTGKIYIRIGSDLYSVNLTKLT